MGIFDWFKAKPPAPPPEPDKPKEVFVGPDANVSMTFADRDITFQGCLAGYNSERFYEASKSISCSCMNCRTTIQMQILYFGELSKKSIPRLVSATVSGL